MLSGLGSMSFARPGALWLGLLLLPILLLYFLRMRFRRKPLGSTFLWKELLAPTSGGETLRKRSILLLLLQAAAVAIAAFAAAGPSLVSRSSPEPGAAFMIDVSASMGSRDCRGALEGSAASRVEAAVEAASKEIDELGEEAPIMTFACSNTAVPLLKAPSSDKAAAKASLHGLSARSAAFEEGSCAEAVSAWLAKAKGAWSGRAYTDGGMDLGGERLAAAFDGSFRATILGSSRPSCGATALRLEESGKGKSRAVFALWNGGASAKEVQVRLTLRSASLGLRRTQNGSVLASGAVRAEPGWSRASLDLDGGIEEGGYALEMESGPDEVEGAPGSICYLSVARQRPLKVLLIGRSDPFLKAALAQGGISYSSLAAFPSSLSAASAEGPGSARGATPSGEISGSAMAAEEKPDIVILESAKAPAAARCNLLVFGAPPPGAPLTSGGPAVGPIASVADEHPLLRFVDWEGASASAGICYAPREEALVLATTGGRPSFVAWEKEGYRSLACGVDLARSDLGLKSAFPVLIRNYIAWAASSVDEQSAYTLNAGELARRLAPESFRLKGSGAKALREGPAVLISAESSGLFEWEAADESGYLAVNVPSAELDTAPRALKARTAIGSAAATADSEEGGRSRLLGPAASLLLALCLALEWIGWNGGSRRKGGAA